MAWERSLFLFFHPNVVTIIVLLATVLAYFRCYDMYEEYGWTGTFHFIKTSPSLIMVFWMAFMTSLVGLHKFIESYCFFSYRRQERDLFVKRLTSYTVFRVFFILAIVPKGFLVEYAAWGVFFCLCGSVRLWSLAVRDRFDYLSLFPNTVVATYYRLLSFLGVIAFFDIIIGGFCWISLLDAGYSYLLLTQLETFTILIDTAQTAIKISIHLIDLSKSARGQSWDVRGNLIFYTEFVCESLVFGLTLLHLLHLLFYKGFDSFSVVDIALFLNVKAVTTNLLRKFQSYKSFRRAMYNLKSQFPDASESDVTDYADTCAICREDLVYGTSCIKKLPCSHLFHLACLRGWVEHQTTCPTCRLSLESQPATETLENKDLNIFPQFTAARLQVALQENNNNVERAAGALLQSVCGLSSCFVSVPEEEATHSQESAPAPVSPTPPTQPSPQASPLSSPSRPQSSSFAGTAQKRAQNLRERQQLLKQQARERFLRKHGESA